MALLGNSGPRHKTFISYHHDNDQHYRDEFERLFTGYFDIMVSKSVQIGDIHPRTNTVRIRQKIRDEYLRDSTVTVVLIGTETWQRKHVDWEIASSIRKTKNNPRSGLLGIVLPSYVNRNIFGQCGRYTIPPRLVQNIDCGYASIHDWSTFSHEVQGWIHNAFLKRKTMNPDNSYDTFVKNRSGDRWY